MCLLKCPNQNFFLTRKTQAWKHKPMYFQKLKYLKLLCSLGNHLETTYMQIQKAKQKYKKKRAA